MRSSKSIWYKLYQWLHLSLWQRIKLRREKWSYLGNMKRSGLCNETQCAAVRVEGIIGGAEEEWAVLGNTKPWCLDFSSSLLVIILHKFDCNLHKRLRKILMALNAEGMASSSCYWWSGHRLSVQRCMMRGCAVGGGARIRVPFPAFFTTIFMQCSLEEEVERW